MILVDASVWIEHLRRPIEELNSLLAQQAVLCHPFVAGELACGWLYERALFLRDLRELPQIHVMDDDRVMEAIDARRLMGRGIGYVDAHLLVSVISTSDAQLWTRDKRLHNVAAELGVAYAPARH